MQHRSDFAAAAFLGRNTREYFQAALEADARQADRWRVRTPSEQTFLARVRPVVEAYGDEVPCRVSSSTVTGVIVLHGPGEPTTVELDRPDYVRVSRPGVQTALVVPLGDTQGILAAISRMMR